MIERERERETPGERARKKREKERLREGGREAELTDKETGRNGERERRNRGFKVSQRGAKR